MKKILEELYANEMAHPGSSIFLILAFIGVLINGYYFLGLLNPGWSPKERMRRYMVVMILSLIFSYFVIERMVRSL